MSKSEISFVLMTVNHMWMQYVNLFKSTLMTLFGVKDLQMKRAWIMDLCIRNPNHHRILWAYTSLHNISNIELKLNNPGRWMMVDLWLKGKNINFQTFVRDAPFTSCLSCAKVHLLTIWD